MNNEPILSNLNDLERNIVAKHLEKYTLTIASDLIANPLPLGIGRRLSRATLCRFRQQFRLQEQLLNREESRLSIEAVLHEASVDQLIPASLVALSEKAFQLSLSDEPNSLQLAARLLAQVTKARESLAGAAQSSPPAAPADPATAPATSPGTVAPSTASPPSDATTLEASLRLQIVRLVLQHSAEIGSIRGNPGLNEERKIDLISKRLFPTPPSPAPAPPAP